MADSTLRVSCLLVALSLITASSVRAGNINFTVTPAIIHAVSHDAGVTVVLVSGEASVLDDASGQPTARLTLDRIPIITRSDPKAWHSTPIDRWLASFTKPMKSGTPIEIGCVAGDLLRDSRNAVQAVYCLGMGPSTGPK